MTTLKRSLFGALTLVLLFARTAASQDMAEYALLLVLIGGERTSGNVKLVEDAGKATGPAAELVIEVERSALLRALERAYRQKIEFDAELRGRDPQGKPFRLMMEDALVSSYSIGGSGSARVVLESRSAPDAGPVKAGYDLKKNEKVPAGEQQPDTAEDDPSQWGEWIADVERPAEGDADSKGFFQMRTGISNQKEVLLQLPGMSAEKVVVRGWDPKRVRNTSAEGLVIEVVPGRLRDALKESHQTGKPLDLTLKAEDDGKYLQWELKNVRVTSYSVSGATDGAPGMAHVAISLGDGGRIE